MKVLFIGGTGVISSACSRLALQRGIELVLLNRGESVRPVPYGAEVLQGDIRDIEGVRQVLQGQIFDVVVNWVVYTPEQAQADIELFRGRTSQYIFISSASAYQTPPISLPVTESTPLRNPYWEYSQNKISCEQRFVDAYRQKGFPVTIVRPSHTYDATMLPIRGGYTVIDRMRRGQPVVVHGDGTSLWTLTHNTDFAKGFVGLLGNPRAVGDAFHITSDEWLPWNAIYEMVAEAAGAEPNLVHIPSDVIACYDPDWGSSLLGDKAHSMIFDNTKIKRLVPDYVATVPFAQGAQEIVDWFDADPSRQAVDEVFNHILDQMVEAQRAAYPA